jgi:hypothetical protein
MLMRIRTRKSNGFLPAAAVLAAVRPFRASLSGQNGLAQMLRISFVQNADDGETMIALLEDAADPLSRASWKGSLRLAEPPQPNAAGGSALIGNRPRLDGWTIALRPADGEDDFPSVGAGRDIVLGVAEDDRVIWTNLPQPAPLSADDRAPPLPDFATLRREVQERTKPGEVWEGRIQYEGDIARKLRLTFVEHRDEGNYVRALVSPADDPHVVAVFEGTVAASPEAIYSWPIRLTRTSGAGPEVGRASYAIDLISSKGGLRLAFSAEGECMGAGSTGKKNAIRLTRAAPVEDFERGFERWRDALPAGARWSGTIVRGDQPAEKIMLTVAEVADQGRAYWLTFHNPDDPHWHRVFRGSRPRGKARACFWAPRCETSSSTCGWRKTAPA